MIKPTYDELVQALRDYSTILHELEEAGRDLLSHHDDVWMRLTVLEQRAVS